MKLFYKILLCCSLLGYASNGYAQTYYSVSNFNSTQTIYPGMNVTVTGIGAGAAASTAGFLLTPCGLSGGFVTPYTLGGATNTNSVKFSFSAPVKKIRVQFGELNNGESTRFFINGTQYAITAANISAITGTSCLNVNGTASGGDYYGVSTCGGGPGGGNAGGQIDINYSGNIDSFRLFGLNSTGCGGWTFNFAFASDTMPFVIQPFKDTVLCPGDSLKLAFSGTEPFKSGNVFTAQLSNAAGSFTAPTVIGTKTATGGPDTIRCYIPKTQIPGTAYRVRITSTNPVRTGPDDFFNIRVKQVPVAFSATRTNPACTGDTIRLVGNTTSTGVTWAWSGPLSYSSTLQSPKIGNVTSSMAGAYIVKATLTSSGCSLSDTGTIAVNPTPAKPVAGSNTPVCFGATITLTASSSTSGVSYSWTGPNSFSSPLQSPTKTGAVVADGGSYIVSATLNGCSAKDTTIVNVYSNVPTPTAGNNGPLCIGSNINLTAGTISGATYTWSGPASYTSNTQNPSIIAGQLANAGVYSVTATVNGCASAPGNTTVSLLQGPTVLAYPSPRDSVCAGKSLTFVALATNAGSGATYQWLKNGFPIAGATSLTYLSGSGVVNGDVFSILVTPGTGAACTTPVNSNPIPITVLQYQTPNVTMTATDTNAWPGLLVNFEATAINAGNSPQYQWKVNSKNVIGATSNIWGAATLLNNDTVCVEVTSSYLCSSPARVSTCKTVKIATGIKAVNNSNTNIYPNPFSGQLTISSQSAVSSVQLVDVFGRIVYNSSATGDKTVIDTHALPVGNYILILTGTDGTRSNYKVVKE